MESVLIEVGMLGHESVLVVDGNPLCFDEDSGNGITCVDTRIGGAVGCFGLDRRDRGPDELAATRECPNSLEEDGKAGFELRFGVPPAVKAVVEVNDGEGDALRSGKLSDLMGQAGITHRC